MKRFVQGEGRSQGTLLPEVLDDYVTENNAVRVIDVFVDQLDLGKLGFEGVEPAATGRPAYHPSTSQGPIQYRGSGHPGPAHRPHRLVDVHLQNRIRSRAPHKMLDLNHRISWPVIPPGARTRAPAPPIPGAAACRSVTLECDRQSPAVVLSCRAQLAPPRS